MNFIKASIFVTALSSVLVPAVQAHEVTTLPTIKVMADSELRDEQVTMTPFQEEKDARKALQHKIIKSEQDIQNYAIKQGVDTPLDYQPQAAGPDWSLLDQYENNAALKAYVLSVASGFQSSDPTSGIFKMLESLGVDRNAAANSVSNGGVIKFNIDANAMQQLFGSKWKDGVPQNLLPKN